MDKKKKIRSRYSRPLTTESIATREAQTQRAAADSIASSRGAEQKISRTTKQVTEIMQKARAVNLESISREEAAEIASDITTKLRFLGADAHAVMKEEDFSLLADLMSKLLGKGKF